MRSESSKLPPVEVDHLVAGYEFPAVSYELSPSVVSKYLGAVGKPAKKRFPISEFVPPLAVAAYTMTAAFQSLLLPPGSIHASQELEFCKPGPIGTIIRCHAKVAQKLQRGKLHLLIFELNTLNQDGGKVLSGKVTVVLPG